MHVRGLIEVAGILATHGPVLLHSQEPLSADSVEQYWTTSKVRLDRWAWSLKNFPKETESDVHCGKRVLAAARGVLEEILVSEVLTRVWTAILCAFDREQGRNEVEPIGRSIMIGHMEARHRVLTLMVRGPGVDGQGALELNHVRRRAEGWTDLLIGSLMRMHDVSEFAVEPDRARQFANDLRERGRLPGGRHAWSLTMVSLRSAFRSGLNPVSPNADLNVRIASSVLSCFPSETFDSTGLFRSVWLMRLNDMADSTQGMIAEILAERSGDAQKTDLAKKWGTRPNRLDARQGRFGT